MAGTKTIDSGIYDKSLLAPQSFLMDKQLQDQNLIDTSQHSQNNAR